MAHEVFISYRSLDRELCDQVVRLVERIGYRPFRDVDDLVAGVSWRQQLEDALRQRDMEPCVIVLCTREAAESTEVAAEVALAVERSVTVIPIELDAGAALRILQAAHHPRPEAIHYIDAIDRSGDFEERLHDSLRRALTHHVRQRLEEHRRAARSWAAGLTPAVSFWEDSWRAHFSIDPEYGLRASVAVTARGGSGKTYLIARCVRELLTNPGVYPVLVDQDFLADAGTKLLALFDARSLASLPEQIEALSESNGRPGWKSLRVVFVVDGLDRMVTPGDVRQQRLVDGLTVLADCAPTIVGCRREVWDAWYRGRVSVTEVMAQELDRRLVASVLGSRTPDPLNPLLLLPLFLDVALRMVEVSDTIPEKETDFLDMIWNDAVLPSGRQLPENTGRQWWLETLARRQLDQLSYDVPYAELVKQPGFQADYEVGLGELKASGVLVEAPSREQDRIVRLRHDLLDNYSMVRLLLQEPGRWEECKALCGRCDQDCGWSLLATLVQAARDWDLKELQRDLFGEFLNILDCKKFGDRHMTRAWAVTHVLRHCFSALFPLIVDALRGMPTASLKAHSGPSPAGTIGSSLESARLTQEAASTLASAFMALREGSREQAAIAVPVLQEGLGRWSLRARLLDALGKFRTEQALYAITGFASERLEKRDDLESLIYVARNLRSFTQAEASDMLMRLARDTTLPVAVQRAAAEGCKPGSITVPARTENEIIAGLEIRRGSSYTDWNIVQEYADYVRGERARGKSYSSQVLDALERALGHQQTFVRRSVARALALFDEVQARDAILDQLLVEGLPSEVRGACVEALEAQIRRLGTPRERQVFHYLLLRAARVARHGGAVSTAANLLDLSSNSQLVHDDDWLRSERALEILPPAPAAWVTTCKLVEQEPDAAVLRELSELEEEDVGPNLEVKYRFAAMAPRDGYLETAVSETTWQLGKRFHNAVRAQPGRFLRDRGRWLVPLPLGRTLLPGIAVVHGILLTTDGQLLLAQRAPRLSYAPLHWSASFEEQVTEADFQDGSAVFQRAARRGALEEFGIHVDASRTFVVSALLELDNLNIGVVVLLEADQTLAEIQRIWSGSPSPSHVWEAHAVRGVPTDEATLDALERGDVPMEISPLHPTSRIRGAMLRRWLRGGRRVS